MAKEEAKIVFTYFLMVGKGYVLVVVVYYCYEKISFMNGYTQF